MLFSNRSEVLREHVKHITDLLKEHEEETKQREKLRDTYFDKSTFASRREVVISPENSMILTLKGASRTPEQVKLIVNNLSWAISSFAEYPHSMQNALAGVAMYQRTNPQRVIIRQGHYPENFYFIISGWAKVYVCKENENTGEYELSTVAKIGKGQCFGEIALIHQTTRQATVESLTEMELLVITKYDFFRIFLSKPEESLEEPEYLKIMRTLLFMHDWPLEKIDEQPGACILHFFRPGTVIVSDSNTSNWIYIVKSGSCVVMKKLRHVVPKRNRSNQVKETNQAESMFGSRKIAPRVDTGRPKPPSQKPISYDIMHTKAFDENIDEEHFHELYLLESHLRVCTDLTTTN